jgi:hypothetical protein
MTGAKISGKGADMKAFLLPALAALVLLAGCSTPTPPAMFCPNVEALQQGRDLVAFAPNVAGPAGVITQARITGVAGACTLHPQKKELVITFRTGFAATNGPANNGQPVTLPYFIAIVNPADNNILAEQFYTATLTFDGNASLAQLVSKPTTLDFPNDHYAGHLQVLVGFKLTPEEQAYNADHPDVQE